MEPLLEDDLPDKLLAASVDESNEPCENLKQFETSDQTPLVCTRETALIEGNVSEQIHEWWHEPHPVEGLLETLEPSRFLVRDGSLVLGVVLTSTPVGKRHY